MGFKYENKIKMINTTSNIRTAIQYTTQVIKDQRTVGIAVPCICIYIVCKQCNVKLQANINVKEYQ